MVPCCCGCGLWCSLSTRFLFEKESLNYIHHIHDILHDMYVESTAGIHDMCVHRVNTVTRIHVTHTHEGWDQTLGLTGGHYGGENKST